MEWIKRNLYFVIGSGVALVLMGLAGGYLYTGWARKSVAFEKLGQQYAELKRLYELNPNPGSDKVNNIRAAKEQQEQLRQFNTRAAAHFALIPPLPPFEGTNKVTSEEFTSQLRRTLDQLQREAAAASVSLPPKFAFSFSAQKDAMTFAPGSLNLLAVQLGEVKALCDAIFAAKVNALDGLRRERVSSDDAKGPPSDYVEHKSVTNDLAVITPYEVTFRCFSAELAAFFNALHSGRHALLVKTINVEAAPAAAADPNMPGGVPTYAPAVAAEAMPDAFRRRYGMAAEGPPVAAAEAFAQRYGGMGPEGGGGPSLGGIAYRPLGSSPAARPYAAAPTAPAPAAPGAMPVRSSLQTVLNEKPLRVTALIHVVKLLPKETNR